MIFAFFLAFLAAFANATSSLLQRQANKDGADVPLVRRPIWLLGAGIAFVSFVLQAIALSQGSLAAIEPVLALELVLVVIGSGIFFHVHIGKQEWISIALMTLGTISLIVALNPQERGFVIITAWQWTAALGLTAALIVGTSLISLRIRRPAYKAGLLGIATGAALGLTSSLLKDAMLVFRQDGIGGVFSSWELYVALTIGLATFWLLQRALAAGKLVASQPGITLVDPYVAIAWGGFVFGEKMNGGVAIILAVVAALALSAGAIVLSRAPALKRG